MALDFGNAIVTIIVAVRLRRRGRGDDADLKTDLQARTLRRRTCSPRLSHRRAACARGVGGGGSPAGACARLRHRRVSSIGHFFRSDTTTSCPKRRGWDPITSAARSFRDAAAHVQLEALQTTPTEADSPRRLSSRASELSRTRVLDRAAADIRGCASRLRRRQAYTLQPSACSRSRAALRRTRGGPARVGRRVLHLLLATTRRCMICPPTPSSSPGSRSLRAPRWIAAGARFCTTMGARVPRRDSRRGVDPRDRAIAPRVLDLAPGTRFVLEGTRRSIRRHRRRRADGGAAPARARAAAHRRVRVAALPSVSATASVRSRRHMATWEGATRRRGVL